MFTAFASILVVKQTHGSPAASGNDSTAKSPRRESFLWSGGRKRASAKGAAINERIETINRQYRSLGRAATHAENCLRAGESDAYAQELAWAALERYRLFEARVEREGLCDLEFLKSEWSQLRDAA
jgi:hypothetical protein